MKKFKNYDDFEIINYKYGGESQFTKGGHVYTFDIYNKKTNKIMPMDLEFNQKNIGKLNIHEMNVRNTVLNTIIEGINMLPDINNQITLYNRLHKANGQMKNFSKGKSNLKAYVDIRNKFVKYKKFLNL